MILLISNVYSQTCYAVLYMSSPLVSSKKSKNLCKNSLSSTKSPDQQSLLYGRNSSKVKDCS
ncbi:hypothetical protein ACS0TY_030669 [Phlomoides rotata]